VKYQISNLSINVEERGSGDLALVFMHYWGGSLRTWNKVIAGLENSYRCVSYDLRRWGQSDNASSFTMADLASDASSIIESLRLKSYILVGHSMSGKAAQLLASRRPAGLLGLVLVAPAPPTPVIVPEDILQQQVHAYDDREAILQTLGFLSARTPSPDIVEQIVEDSLAGSAEAKCAWLRSGREEDISSEVGKIAVPTLVLAGDRDNVDSMEQQQREVVGRIAGARLEIVPESGHLIPVDQPERITEAIRGFVAGLRN
jgi:3-oxoadipate enol-lactonase